MGGTSEATKYERMRAPFWLQPGCSQCLPKSSNSICGTRVEQSLLEATDAADTEKGLSNNTDGERKVCTSDGRVVLGNA